MDRTTCIIMGAAGRDFHNFNMVFRDDGRYRVACFTAAQIPGIEGRLYPPELAGPLYPAGIPIYPEAELPDLIRNCGAQVVVFSYSDVSHEHVMHCASIAAAAGADFWLLGPGRTMLRAPKPVVAVVAVRTGAGKSQTTRRVCVALREMGKKPVVVRHPMPYGDLRRQVCQRLATYDDLDRHECTIEEREEYEPHIRAGTVVYAGVDYEAILRQAADEGEVIVWDGGNNDFPFYRPDVLIVVADPHRPGHELRYHPGETNLRMADVVVINKVDTARAEDVARVRATAQAVNPRAVVIMAASPIAVEDGEAIRGKRVLVIEDGPTLTHGEMSYGAGVVAARAHGAAEIVDPRSRAVGTIREVYGNYPAIGPLLPAMGYGPQQVAELEQTINACACDLVVVATPVDLRRFLRIDRPAVRVTYELAEQGHPTLYEVLRDRLP